MSEKPKTGCVARGCAMLLVTLLAIMVGIALVSSGRKATPDEATPTRTAPAPEVKKEKPPEINLGEDAYYLARESCKRLLKAPSTASFSSPYSDSDTGWANDGYKQWRVFGHVDSQNPFGVMLRSQWRATVQVNIGKLEVVYLKVGDSEAGEQPPMREAPVQVTPDQQVAAMAAAAEKRVNQRAAELKRHQELAARGDAYGQLKMGERYLKGDGVEEDKAEAISLLLKSAAQGNSAAQALLRKITAPPPPAR